MAFDYCIWNFFSRDITYTDYADENEFFFFDIEYTFLIFGLDIWVVFNFFIGKA